MYFIAVWCGNVHRSFPRCINDFVIITSQEKRDDNLDFQFCDLHSRTRMPSSTPSQKEPFPALILFSWRGKTVRIEFRRVCVDVRVQMHIGDVVRHEVSPLNYLVTDVYVGGDIAAEEGGAEAHTHGLADDELEDGHLVFPGGNRYGGEALMDWV